MARSSRSSSSFSSSSSSSSSSGRFTSSSTDSLWRASHRRIPSRHSLSVRFFAYVAGASPTSDTIRVLTKETPDYSSQGGQFVIPERQCFWVEESCRGSSRSRTPSPRQSTPVHPAARGSAMPSVQPGMRPQPARGMPGVTPVVPGTRGAPPMMGQGAGRGRPPMNHPAPMPGHHAGVGGPPPGFRPPPPGNVPAAS